MKLLRPFSGCLRIAAWLALGWPPVSALHAETMDSIQQQVRKRFPSVRQISPRELSAWLSDTNRAAPLLVDVREPAEYAVSHLAGARNLPTVPQVRSVLRSNAGPVVVYCSVGLRSAALAEKLQQAGMTNIVNLEGSLFAWANEGRPLYRGTNLVREVHGYSSKWRQLLHADVPVKL